VTTVAVPYSHCKKVLLIRQLNLSPELHKFYPGTGPGCGQADDTMQGMCSYKKKNRLLL